MARKRFGSKKTRRSFGKRRRSGRKKSKRSKKSNKKSTRSRSFRNFGRRSRNFGRRSRSFGRRSRNFGRRSRSFGRRSRSFGRRSRNFGSGPSLYQDQVNDLTGSMGPKNTAYWKDTGVTTGNPWDLGAAPLYFSPSAGKYVTSFEQNAAPQSVSFEALPKSYGVLGSWNPSKGLSFGRKRKKPKKKKSLRKTNCVSGCSVSMFGSKFGNPPTMKQLDDMVVKLYVGDGDIDEITKLIDRMTVSPDEKNKLKDRLEDIKQTLMLERLEKGNGTILTENPLYYSGPDEEEWNKNVTKDRESWEMKDLSDDEVDWGEYPYEQEYK